MGASIGTTGSSSASSVRAPCVNACVGTPWVCAVLPTDSGSEGEREDAGEEDETNAGHSAMQATSTSAALSVASTCTPPPAASPGQPPSQYGASESVRSSETHSER